MLFTVRVEMKIFILPTVVKVPDEYKAAKRLDSTVLGWTPRIVSCAIQDRSVAGRHGLSPGRYCVIPMTERPGEENDFFLRIFYAVDIEIE